MPMGVPAADMVPAQLGLLDGATDIPVSVIVPERVELAVLDAYRRHGAERAFILLSTKPEWNPGTHRNIRLSWVGTRLGGPRQYAECMTAAMQ